MPIIPANVTEATITIPYPPVPVYKELDKRFLGDKVTSYGGFLRFTVEEEGGEELPPEVKAKFPLVRIFGRDDLVLDYYEVRICLKQVSICELFRVNGL